MLVFVSNLKNKFYINTNKYVQEKVSHCRVASQIKDH